MGLGPGSVLEGGANRSCRAPRLGERQGMNFGSGSQRTGLCRGFLDAALFTPHGVRGWDGPTVQMATLKPSIVNDPESTQPNLTGLAFFKVISIFHRCDS